jgi:DNA-directed RNA polymerase specialized sigma24 family protein
MVREQGVALRHLHPFAYNVGYRFRGGDIAFAEDVAQESLTRLFAPWPRLRAHLNLEGWITVTAFHVALEFDRAQRRASRATVVARSSGDSVDGDCVADADLLCRHCAAYRLVSNRLS